MLETPTVFSVIIPTKNRPAMLLRAVQSLAAQTFRNFEGVIVNDGDIPVLEEVRTQSCHLRIIEGTANQGVSRARNTGIASSSGCWAVFLDDDDELNPTYLQRLYDSILADPELGLIWCGVEIIFNDSDICSSFRTFSSEYTSKEHLFRDALSIGASYGMAVKLNLLKDLGGFDTSFLRGEDTELIVRLLSQGVKARPIADSYVKKHESHPDRLAGDYEKYSKEKIFERIFSAHSAFFKAHPYNYKCMLEFAFTVHVRSRNFKLADVCLRKILFLGYFRYFCKGTYIRYSAKRRLPPAS